MEISRNRNGTAGWRAVVGPAIREGFPTRDDALRWAREELARQEAASGDGDAPVRR